MGEKLYGNGIKHFKQMTESNQTNFKEYNNFLNYIIPDLPFRG
jgi:hypothetical protein